MTETTPMLGFQALGSALDDALGRDDSVILSARTSPTPAGECSRSPQA